ncbi:MAG: YfhO family protein [Chloroflexi bacterium]|nr:YfhO family protein [Chloroflexota bacterium]
MSGGRANGWAKRIARPLGALAVFVALSVLMTYPLVLDPGGSVLGPPQDNYYYLSWFAWFRHTLVDLRAPSTFNPGVFYPFGHDFSTSETTWANLALGLPALLIWGEVAAFNLSLFLSFVLSGLGMYVLISSLTGSWWAGLVGGAIYAFSPYRLAHVAGGQLPLLGTQWLPLCLWSLERVLRDRRWAWGLGVGFFFALTALSSWYYAFMAGLLLPIYALVRARPWREHLRQRHVWAALGAAVLVAALCIGPAIWPTLELSGQETMSYSLQWVDRWSASVADYLLPNVMQPLWGGATTGFYQGQRYFYERVLYLGYVPLLLAGYALWRARRKGAALAGTWPRVVTALLWMGGLAFILSLGTTLHWRDVAPVHIPVPAGLDQLFDRFMFNWVTRFSLNASEYHWGYQQPGHIVLPLPAMLLYLYLPFSNAMRVWSRFGLLVSLCLAVLAGGGVALLRAELKRWGGAATAAGLALLALVLFEYAAIPFPYGVSQVEAQPATTWLSEQEGDFAVMELPLSRALNGPPLYAGLLHGKPLAYGYGTFFPDAWVARWDTLQSFPSDASLEVLAEWDVRYVLVAARNYGDDWSRVTQEIAAQEGLQAVGVFPERELYRGDRWFTATRGTDLPFVADEIHVFELRVP